MFADGTGYGYWAVGWRTCLAINQSRPAVIYCSVSLFNRNKAHCSQSDWNREVSQDTVFDVSVNSAESINIAFQYLSRDSDTWWNNTIILPSAGEELSCGCFYIIENMFRLYQRNVFDNKFCFDIA